MKKHIKTILILIWCIILLITFINHPAQTTLGILGGFISGVAYIAIYSAIQYHDEQTHKGGNK
jgi:hypothetical protein